MEQGGHFIAPKPSTNDRNMVTPVKLDQQQTEDLEDSGFSSIADSVTGSAASNNDSEKPGSAFVDAQSSIFSFLSHQQGNQEKEQKLAEEREKKQRLAAEEKEKKRLADEEYHREESERRYKRLMHLLDESQFYANLILNKNKDSKEKPSTSSKSTKKKSPEKEASTNNSKAATKKIGTKHKIVVTPKENSPPSKRLRRNLRSREEHDLKDFVTSRISSRLRDRRNLKKVSLEVEDHEDDSLESSLEEVEKVEKIKSRLRDRGNRKKVTLEEDSEDDTLQSSLEETIENGKEVEDTLVAATPEDVVFTPPKYFVGELRDYQIEGLKWLKVLHQNGLNGILADEMGLGKTIQVIALFCELIEKRQSGPYLIVAPLSTIPNWLLEFQRFAPKLPVVLFHGDRKEKYEVRSKILKKYLVENGYKMQPIVITTYEVPLREKSFLQTQTWRYIVIDEGQRIKNPECQLVKILKNLKSMNRLLLTGTPLQNNMSELWSLLNFLLPDIFNDLAVFESWFDVKELQNEEGTMKFLQQEEEKKVVASLREILKPFMLRRIKADVCLEIPPMKEIVVYAPLTVLQRDLYKAVLNWDLQTLCKIDEEPLIVDVDGVRPKRKCVLKRSIDSIYSNNTLQISTDSTLQNSVSSSSGTIDFASNESDGWKPNPDELNMLPALETASSSDGKMDVWTNFFNLGDALQTKSKFNCEKSSNSTRNTADVTVHKLMTNVYDPAPSCSSSFENLNRMDEFNSKNLLVCNMNKLIVDDNHVQQKENDNYQKTTMDNKLSASCFNIEQGSHREENMGYQSSIPETSAISSKKLNSSKIFKKDSKILSVSSASKDKVNKKASSKFASTKSMKKSSSLYNLKASAVKEMIEKDPLDNDDMSLPISSEITDDFNENDEHEYSIRGGDLEDLKMWKQYSDVNERNREFFLHLTFGQRIPMYKKIVNHPYLVHCPRDSVGLPKIDDKLIKASGKLMVLDQMLAKLKERGHKILLFSTWTKILNILEDYLSMRNYEYKRLDGSTPIEKRKEDITLFNNDPNIFLYLISVRAGGVGLNLAGADTVIVYDSDWNPQVDIQAMARCHRIGQTKPVVVYKLCTKGTIDEKIMQRADAKRKLEKMVISKKDIGFNLNNRDNLLKLKQLLTSNDSQVVVTSEKDVFTEEELEKLLDRNDLLLQQPAAGSHQPKKVLGTSKLENS